MVADILIILAFGGLYFTLILKIKDLENRISELESEIGKCPHGYEDWSDCPDCGH